ncbi:S24/S26 family peptidase [Microbacterium sp. KR10-403]|uniref:S24/S26 family peptidase n=1 Tax=Microbacterium sp. KR10-403 TaxID=3158581 RepID=UPI0032E4D1DD
MLEATTETIAAEKESSGSFIKDVLKSTGELLLSVFQFATVALVIFSLIPLLFSFFMGVSFNKVLTGSMEPTYMVGDVLVTAPAVGGDLVTGSVVGVNLDGIRYTHRVKEVHEDGTATTQGDANNVADLFKPSQKDLFGVVVNHIPQPFASTITLFTINTEWWVDASELVSAGDWGNLSKLQADAPWGFFVLLGAVLLLFWLIPDLVAFAEKRAESKKSKRSSAAVEEPAS